tara:strand:- start:552 stop:1892 length:1341 start_codon:yes stop_codon:yes gene_type:complete
MEQAAKSGTDYIVVEAIISSTRNDTEVDIKALVSEFIIYEHIEKPYLTGRLSFKEEENILQDIDFQGGEKLTITIQHLEEVVSANTITKEFLVDKIENTVRVDERTEFVILHLTEYHVFDSSAQTVSKAYNGAPTSIIKTITESFLDKEVLIDGVDDVRDMKVIIPNLNPLEAGAWLTKRATTSDGLPFFFFSTLGTENLVLKDLEKMLTQQPINAEAPYIYAPSAGDGNEDVKNYLILNYKYESSENLLRIMRKGHVNAKHVFHDTMKGIPTNINFDVDNVFQTLITKNALGGENSRYNHSPEFKVKGKKIGQHNSKIVSQISSSGAYDTVGTTFKSYQAETTVGGQAKKINRESLKEFMVKTPLVITVRGREFITGDANYTIGKTIRIRFLDSNPYLDDKTAKLDLKKSGDYIIMTTKHVFSDQGITSELTCGRIASLGVETEL